MRGRCCQRGGRGRVGVSWGTVATGRRVRFPHRGGALADGTRQRGDEFHLREAKEPDRRDVMGVRTPPSPGIRGNQRHPVADWSRPRPDAGLPAGAVSGPHGDPAVGLRPLPETRGMPGDAAVGRQEAPGRRGVGVPPRRGRRRPPPPGRRPGVAAARWQGRGGWRPRRSPGPRRAGWRGHARRERGDDRPPPSRASLRLAPRSARCGDSPADGKRSGATRLSTVGRQPWRAAAVAVAPWPHLLGGCPSAEREHAGNPPGTCRCALGAPRQSPP
ncbi:hypothetical protein SAMN04487983_1016126 [Streptomyces sp. yr375]|nr:hypothetical protein SAMN04487983_1016126 [Streptomyces sp. yr375]